MNLYEALEQIAEKYDLNADELKTYVDEDSVGGWHTAPDVARWPMGSLFGVEGQIIFALVRALKPLNVINLGYFRGASTAHIAAALKANGNQKARVYAVDRDPINLEMIPIELHEYIKPVEQDAIEFLNAKWPAKVMFAIEDLEHTSDQVQAVWEIFKRKANQGAILASHDISHYVVGGFVKEGIEAAGIDLEDGLELLIEPSDCGLFLYKQTGDV